MNQEIPPLIAVIGSDGSGKSTVCEHLINYVKKYGPAVRVHLGKQAGNVGRAVSQLPLIGNSVGRSIVSNTKKVRSKKSRLSVLPALVITFFVFRRLRRFKRMLAFRRQGFIILADRFPQAQIPGAYDGPIFPLDTKGNWLVRRLATLEHNVFHRMTSYKPDLVIKLNVDLDVACARKPDHRKDALARKIAITPQLKFEGANIVDIDANKSLDEVIASVEAEVARFMASQGYTYLDDIASGDAK
ncbi:Thymidylate kinase [Kosakonia radicincitans]|uniref:ATP-binding protein n=1 Tax=Kosakonia radicincitans TaxID=283686 RepID=UPI0009A5B1F2|nr:ATP-binding protein [Kosakonia radicincitans]SKC18981.1 Thymidylate kinase [Kosakonia radicincitans]